MVAFAAGRRARSAGAHFSAIVVTRPSAYDVETPPAERLVMKKLLVILILVAIGVAVAKKVRDSA